MDIQLLVVPDCPNAAPAADLLRSALAEAALPDATFRTIVIADEEEAQRHHFIGSPTILLDAEDPFAQPDQPFGLSCRLYQHPDGHRSGLPDLGDLARALTQSVQNHETKRRRA